MKEIIIALGSVITSLGFGWLFGRSTGRAKEQAREAKEVIKMVRKANEVEDDLAQLDDDELSERMRKWARD